MSGIDALPDEIIARIIVIGSQLPVPGVDTPLDIPTEVSRSWQIPHVRLKRFALLMALTCSRVFQIVKLRTYRHLWVAGVRITGHTSRGIEDSLRSLKSVLCASDGSDLDVYLASNVFLLDIQTRLFLHGLDMLVPVRQQIRSITSHVLTPIVYSFLLSFVGNPEPAPGLQWVSIMPNDVFTQPRWDHELDCGLYSLPAPSDYFRLAQPQVSHLTLESHFVTNETRMPPNLESLSLHLVQKVTWNNLKTMLEHSSSLLFLEILEKAPPTIDTRIWDTLRESGFCRFNNLKTLFMTSLMNQCLLFLSSGNFPELRAIEFSFAPQEVPTDGSLDLPKSTIRFKYIKLGGNIIGVLNFLSHFDLSSLRMLQIDEGGRSTWKVEELNGNKLNAPGDLRIYMNNLASALLILSSLDLSTVNSLSTGYYNDGPKPELVDKSIQMPRVQILDLPSSSNSGMDGTTIVRYLDLPSVITFKICPPSHSDFMKLYLLKNLSEYEAQISNLHLNIPNDNINAILLHFPKIQHLTLQSSSFTSPWWSRSSFRSIIAGNFDAARWAMPNLRSIEVRLSLDWLRFWKQDWMNEVGDMLSKFRQTRQTMGHPLPETSVVCVEPASLVNELEY